MFTILISYAEWWVKIYPTKGLQIILENSSFLTLYYGPIYSYYNWPNDSDIVVTYFPFIYWLRIYTLEERWEVPSKVLLF